MTTKYKSPQIKMFSLLAFSACLQIKLAFVKDGAVKIVNKLKQILQDLI